MLPGTLKLATSASVLLQETMCVNYQEYFHLKKLKVNISAQPHTVSAVFAWLSKVIGFGFGFTSPFGWLVYLLWFWFYDSQVKTALLCIRKSHIEHTFFIIPAQKDRNVDSEPKSFWNSWRNLFPHFLLLPLWTQVNYCKCGTSCKVWRSLFAFDYTHLRNLWKFAFL